MNIVIAGGTGFVGHHVSQLLLQEGHSVIVLSRNAKKSTPTDAPQAQHIQWDGCTQGTWAQECDGADVVINLSGAPIADKRWTPSRKRELTRQPSRLHPYVGPGHCSMEDKASHLSLSLWRRVLRRSGLKDSR